MGSGSGLPALDSAIFESGCRTSAAAAESARVEYQQVAPRFCETLKIPLLEEREFQWKRQRAPRRAWPVINETGPPPWRRARRCSAHLMRMTSRTRWWASAKTRNCAAWSKATAVSLPAVLAKQPRPQTDARMLVRVAGDPQRMLANLAARDCGSGYERPAQRRRAARAASERGLQARL